MSQWVTGRASEVDDPGNKNLPGRGSHLIYFTGHMLLPFCFCIVHSTYALSLLPFVQSTSLNFWEAPMASRPAFVLPTRNHQRTTHASRRVGIDAGQEARESDHFHVRLTPRKHIAGRSFVTEYRWRLTWHRPLPLPLPFSTPSLGSPRGVKVAEEAGYFVTIVVDGCVALAVMHVLSAFFPSHACYLGRGSNGIMRREREEQRSV